MSYLKAKTRSELWIGWLVLGFVILAILYGLVALLSNRAFVIPARWMNVLFLPIGTIGLLVAAYIAYVQLFRVPAICGPFTNCNTVLQSRYAKLLGFVPNSVLGMISYFALFFLWVWQQQRQDWLSLQAPLLMIAITLLGSLLSVYLTVLQVFVLRALCMWCLSSAMLITILFLLSISIYQSSPDPSAAQITIYLSF
ncbi:MAG: vitamin K epoxide reductase family protein [Anaerolineales bacterium]